MNLIKHKAVVVGLAASAFANATVPTLKAAWKFPLPEMGMRLVASNDRFIYLADDKSVIAVSVSTGKQAWRTEFKFRLDRPDSIPLEVRKVKGGLLVSCSRARTTLLEYFDANTGKLLWEFLPLDGAFLEGIVVEGSRAIVCLESVGDMGIKFNELSCIDFAVPGKPNFFTKMTPEALGDLKQWGYAFGRVFYAVRNQGSKAAWVDNVKIDSHSFPAESATSQVWALPGAYQGVLTSGEFNPNPNSERYRPIFTFARWSPNFELRYWSYSGYVGSPESPDIAGTVEVITWKDKVYACGASVYRILKTAAEGIKPVANIDQVLIVDGNLFGLRQPDNQHLSLFRTKDGERFTLTNNFPMLPTGSWTDYQAQAVTNGIARVVGHTTPEKTTKTLEFFRLEKELTGYIGSSSSSPVRRGGSDLPSGSGRRSKFRS